MVLLEEGVETEVSSFVESFAKETAADEKKIKNIINTKSFFIFILRQQHLTNHSPKL